MKKLKLLLLFSTIFSLSQGQDFNEKLKNARMGLYVAPAVNFIQTDSDKTDTSNNPGIIYGYAFEIALNENHRIESGFAISYKGGGVTQHNSSDHSTSITSDYKMQYVTVPFFIKMRSRQIGYLNYFARIGPSINFKIKEMISSNIIDSGKLALVDISIFLGTEYSLGGKTSIEASLFFNNNLTDAINNNNTKLLFHQLGIRIGFLF